MPLSDFSTLQDVSALSMISSTLGWICFYYGIKWQHTWARLAGYILYAFSLLLLLAFWSFPLTAKPLQFYSMLFLFGAWLWESMRLLQKHSDRIYFREQHLIGVGKTIVALLPIYVLFMPPWDPLITLTGTAVYAVFLLVYGIMRPDHILRLISYALYGVHTVILVMELPYMVSMPTWQWYSGIAPLSSCALLSAATFLVYYYQDQFEVQERRYAFGYCLFLSLVSLYSWFSLITVRFLGKEKYAGPGFLRPFFERSNTHTWNTRKVSVQSLLIIGAAVSALCAYIGSYFDRSRILRMTAGGFVFLCLWRCYKLIRTDALGMGIMLAGIILAGILVTAGMHYYWKKDKILFRK
jgi:hypothetical protein